MTPTEFPQQTLVIAKDQPEYLPIPAHFDREQGVMTFCWRLTWRERLTLLLTGRLWHQVLTIGSIQPVMLNVESPFEVK